MLLQSDQKDLFYHALHNHPSALQPLASSLPRAVLKNISYLAFEEPAQQIEHL